MFSEVSIGWADVRMRQLVQTYYHSDQPLINIDVNLIVDFLPQYAVTRQGAQHKHAWGT